MSLLPELYNTFTDLHNVVNDLYRNDPFFSGNRSAYPGVLSRTVNSLRPFKCNHWTTEQQHIYELDTPGIPKDNLVMSIDKKRRTLTVTGKRENKREEEHDGYNFQEFSYGDYKRTFQLPEDVNLDDSYIANYNDGTLTLKLNRYKPQDDQDNVQVPVKIE